MSSNVVTINILGQEYTLKTSADPEYIQKVAKYVNEKMEEIIESGIDSQSQQLRIAILASMNITDELFMNKSDKRKLIDTIEAKTLAISDYVNDKINEVESKNNS